MIPAPVSLTRKTLALSKLFQVPSLPPPLKSYREKSTKSLFENSSIQRSIRFFPKYFLLSLG